jgi:hypothetical protein
MCKENEFVEKATKIIFNACKESMAKVKEGDTIVIDEKYKYDYGDFHKWCAGDEFRVQLVDKHNPYMTILNVVATKAPADKGGSPRGKVGAEVEFNTQMLVFNYLRVKGDMTAKNNMRKLCRDYLEGLM